MLKLTDSIRYSTLPQGCLERYERWAEGFLNLGCGKTYRVVQIDQNKLVLAEAKTSFSYVATIRKMILFVLTLGLLPLAALAIRTYCRSKHRVVFHSEAPAIQPVVKPAAPVPNLYLLCRLAGYRGPQHAEQASLAAWLEINGKTVRFLNGSKEGFTDTPGLEHFVNVKKLDLSFNGLKTVPEAIQHLKQLQELDFSGNPIETWPKWLEELASQVVVIVNPKQKPPQILLDKLSQHREIQKTKSSNNHWQDFVIPAVASMVVPYFESHKDLMRLARVNRQWKAVADSNDTWNHFIRKYEVEGRSLIVAKNTAKKQLFAYCDALRAILSDWRYELDAQTLHTERYNVKRLKNCVTRKKVEELRVEKLSFVPVELIGKLTSLKSLSLSDTKLETWPESWSKLTNLKKIYLWGTALTKLGAITAMKWVTDLSIRSCNLRNLDGIEALENLAHLDVFNNALNSIQGIEKLRLLKTVILSDNPLRDFRPLDSLYATVQLEINQYQCIQIPSKILKEKLANKSIKFGYFEDRKTLFFYTESHIYQLSGFNNIFRIFFYKTDKATLKKSDLPIEAMSTLYLSKNDLLMCSYVNRAWNKASYILWQVMVNRDYERTGVPRMFLHPVTQLNNHYCQAFGCTEITLY